MKSSKGFTLIELVIVIIVLGILSATAIPKFINIHSDARKAALDGFIGGFTSTNSIVMSKAAILGVENSVKPQKLDGTDIYIEDGSIMLTVDNIKSAMNISGFNIAEGGSTDGGNTIIVYLGDKLPRLKELTKNKCSLYIVNSYTPANGSLEKGLRITKEYDKC
ncbi:type II secretion system protein [Moritella sp. F3]|uniref:type II secretion system protein n=1 Tax=Moritella sp. F3 TaxID=2718882 RepID=UPI0018E1B0DA|nr:prepilin-type N-terminal cleavage/methylation domain-containing protein [Moritella sp. F3]GIC75283.1 hypothetical protein FMO001_00100 [Moritella sp. F1]GIC80428.1 hypothetical protein FMO003_07090 [Moritella sp. F3]